MSDLDWLWLRSCPVEFRSFRSVGDTLERLRQAFPLRDAWALSQKPFAPATNVGSFEGDMVCLRIIDMASRTWLHPELYAQVRAVNGGCVVAGVMRYDRGLRVLYFMASCALFALVGGMTWSLSSSLSTTALVAPATILVYHVLMASHQVTAVQDLKHEVTKACA